MISEGLGARASLGSQRLADERNPPSTQVMQVPFVVAPVCRCPALARWLADEPRSHHLRQLASGSLSPLGSPTREPSLLIAMNSLKTQRAPRKFG
eukprot:COSAG04_NODE_1117_length_8197_cov_19.090258_12_plen_95_part_00